MPELPSYIILPDKLYILTIHQPVTTGRAFDRCLIDYLVDGENPLLSSDSWRTRLGITRELSDDYNSFRLPIPKEWILFRFLCHFVRTNSVHILSGPGGEVLTTNNYRNYLGSTTTDDQAEDILRVILGCWVRIFPDRNLSLADIYVSTDIPYDVLIRTLNILRSQSHIEEI
ncbi:MAG: hypothetical protein NTY95_17650 [Bacteroidia bacterium]|nr:hypothetical protein [Bacteroidia bacterium]